MNAGFSFYSGCLRGSWQWPPKNYNSLPEGLLPSERTAPTELTLASGFSAFVVRAIALGCPGTVALGSCGIAPSRGAGFNSFSAGVMFLLSVVTKFELEATSSDIGTSDEGNTSATIGTSSMGVGVLSADSSLERDTVIISRGMAPGVFVGASFAGVTEVLFSLFLSIGGDKVCSKADGAASVSEPEVTSAPVSVPDDPFG